MRPGCCPWTGAGVGQEHSSLQPGCGGWGVGELNSFPLPGSSSARLTRGTLGVTAAAAPRAASTRGSGAGCRGHVRRALQGWVREVQSSSWAFLF